MNATILSTIWSGKRVRERQTVLDWATARDDGAGSSDNYDVQSSSHIIGKLLTLSLQAGCPFFHQTSRVKALRGLNRSTNEWMTTSHIPLFVVTKRQNCAAQLTTLSHGTLSSLCWTLWTIHEISELDSTARIFNTTTSQLHLLLQLLLLLILLHTRLHHSLVTMILWLLLSLTHISLLVFNSNYDNIIQPQDIRSHCNASYLSTMRLSLCFLQQQMTTVKCDEKLSTAARVNKPGPLWKFARKL